MKNILNKLSLPVLSVACLFLFAVPLHAQNGCVNSPENPTIILALVGSAGGLLSAGRARWKNRRK